MINKTQLHEAYTHEYELLEKEFEEGFIDFKEYKRQRQNLDRAYEDDLEEFSAL